MFISAAVVVSLAPKRDKTRGSAKGMAKTMPGWPCAIFPAQKARQEHVKINRAGADPAPRKGTACKAKSHSKNTSPFRKRSTDSRGYFPDRVWQEVKSRVLDLHERRLKLMDENGIEMMLLSLNAPAVQAIPDTAQAHEIARRANDYLAEQVAKRPDRFQGLAALPMQDPDMRGARARALRQGARLGGALVNGFSQVGDADTRRLLRPAAIPAVLGGGRTARRAVLSASAQPAAARRPHLRRAPLAAGPDLGVRPGDGGACAAPDGLGPVRRAIRAADRPRPHGRGPAVQHVARRQLQRLDPEAATHYPAKKKIGDYFQKTSTSPRRATSARRR